MVQDVLLNLGTKDEVGLCFSVRAYYWLTPPPTANWREHLSLSEISNDINSGRTIEDQKNYNHITENEFHVKMQ